MASRKISRVLVITVTMVFARFSYGQTIQSSTALILSDTITLFLDSALYSPISTVNKMELVKVTMETEGIYLPKGHYWKFKNYLIETKSGKKGWVTGEHLGINRDYHDRGLDSLFPKVMGGGQFQQSVLWHCERHGFEEWSEDLYNEEVTGQLALTNESGKTLLLGSYWHVSVGTRSYIDQIVLQDVTQDGIDEILLLTSEHEGEGDGVGRALTVYQVQADTIRKVLNRIVHRGRPYQDLPTQYESIDLTERTKKGLRFSYMEHLLPSWDTIIPYHESNHRTLRKVQIYYKWDAENAQFDEQDAVYSYVMANAKNKEIHLRSAPIDSLEHKVVRTSQPIQIIEDVDGAFYSAPRWFYCQLGNRSKGYIKTENLLFEDEFYQATIDMSNGFLFIQVGELRK